jgi:hypothetical protein
VTQGFEYYSLDVQEVEFEVGLGDWVLDNTTTSQGYYSATSGDGQGNSQTRYLEAYIDSTSNYTSVSFDLNVSSEQNFDFLVFYVDGTEQDRWRCSLAARVIQHLSWFPHTEMVLPEGLALI